MAQIRRSARARYHRAIKFFKVNNELARFARMRECLAEGPSRDLWSEVKRMRGKDATASGMVEDCVTEGGIAEVFSEKHRA